MKEGRFPDVALHSQPALWERGAGREAIMGRNNILTVPLWAPWNAGPATSDSCGHLNVKKYHYINFYDRALPCFRMIFNNRKRGPLLSNGLGVSVWFRPGWG